MKLPSPFLATLAAALLLSGCATLDSRSQKLNLGMTKEQTTSLLGDDYKVVGARETADARKAEVIRYDDPKYGELLLYFRDGKLVQWGDIRILDNMPESVQ
jgi:hypothetical protein